MGVTVRQKVKGKGTPWWVFISHNGKRTSRKVGDKQAAEAVASKIRAKLQLGEFGFEEQVVPTFKKYADSWINTTVPATCKPSTQKSYEELLEQHILPVFRDSSVSEINRLKIKNFLMEKIKAGYASSTVGHMKSVISGILNLAADDNAIVANPAHRLGKAFKSKPMNDEVNPLTKEELSTLLKSLQEHFPKHHPMALTLARTGMRLGEVIALQWGDIDFQGRLITVQRSFSLDTLQSPKSGKARRVDMSKQLTEVLRELKHQGKIKTIKKGWGEVPQWVFTNENGGSIDPNHWRKRVFVKALEKGGLRTIRIHDLRHTYASLLIQQKESLAYIRDQLGHHSIKVTVDIYGHLAPGGNKEAVDKLDDTTSKDQLGLL